MTRSSTEPDSGPNQPDAHTFQEETFVMTTACHAIEAMCKGAGDFMASRIETEFPRWERLYRRVWSKVRQDAVAANERRTRQHRQKDASSDQDTDLSLALFSSLTLSPTTPGSRAFTPHHTLWRALISLFLTVLAHVRLPLEVGDQICERLGSWIALFVGPEYYFRASRHTIHPAALDEAQRSMLESVEDAIRAMETWNADLTWFIFVRERMKVADIRPVPGPLPLELFGETMQFSEVSFSCL
jgi:hypothetical protein